MWTGPLASGQMTEWWSGWECPHSERESWEGRGILFTLEEEEVIPELRRPRAMGEPAAADESMDHKYETAIVSPTIDLWP